jgi:hypothetical protein
MVWSTSTADWMPFTRSRKPAGTENSNECRSCPPSTLRCSASWPFTPVRQCRITFAVHLLTIAACIMNFITFDAAYSLYPNATFEHLLNLALKMESDNDQRCVAKYAKKGWRTIANFWPQDEQTAAIFAVENKRSIGDNMCWTLPLNVTCLPCRPRLSTRSEAFRWDPASHTSWLLQLNTYSPWKVAPSFCLVKTPVFRFTYTRCKV